MPGMDIRTHGDGAFNDIPREKLLMTHEPIRVTALAGGMVGGNPSVGIGMFLPHAGGCIIGETSLSLFLTAADVLRDAHGDPRPDSLENWIERAAPIAFRGVDCGTWHVTSADQLTQVVTCNDRCATWRDAMFLAFMRTGG